MTLADFSGQGQGRDQITLSTLHSAKGREFRIVFPFGMDQSVIPWNNIGDDQLREFRCQFYVGFTRAEEELHIVYSAQSPSRFVVEVSQRLTLHEGRRIDHDTSVNAQKLENTLLKLCMFLC